MTGRVTRDGKLRLRQAKAGKGGLRVCRTSHYRATDLLVCGAGRTNLTAPEASSNQPAG